MRYLLFTLTLTLVSLAPASASPYRIPEPDFQVCTSGAVFDELSERLADGTLNTEADLLASLNFVQDCEQLRRRKSPLP